MVSPPPPSPAFRRGGSLVFPPDRGGPRAAPVRRPHVRSKAANPGAGVGGAPLYGPRGAGRRATLISAAQPAPFQSTFRRPPPARPLRPARPLGGQTDSAPPPPPAAGKIRARPWQLYVRARARAYVRAGGRRAAGIRLKEIARLRAGLAGFAVARWGGRSCGLGAGYCEAG